MSTPPTYEIGLTLPAELELTEEEINTLGEQFVAEVIEVLRARGEEVEIPNFDDQTVIVSQSPEQSG